MATKYQSVQLGTLAILSGTTNELYLTWTWPYKIKSYYKKVTKLSGKKTFKSYLAKYPSVLGKNTNTNYKAIVKVNGTSDDTTLISRATSGKLIKSTKTATVKHTKEYSVVWQYQVNGVWFEGATETTTYKNSQYTIPDNATQVRVRVKAVANEDSNDKVYWTSSWSSWKSFNVSKERPGELTVDATFLDKTTEADRNNGETVYYVQCVTDASSDGNTTHVQFKIAYDGGSVVYTDSTLRKLPTDTKKITFTYRGDPDKKYVASVRGYNSKGKIYGEWSTFESSQVVKTPPNAPTLSSIEAESSTSATIVWKNNEGTSAESYTIYYGTPTVTSEVTEWNEITIDDPQLTTKTAPNLTTGAAYTFAISATNESGTSPKNIYPDTVSLGLKPDAPTTWSNSTSIKNTEDIILYWVHNTRDGSREKYANIKMDVSLDNGSTWTETVVQVDSTQTDPDVAETIYTYTIPAGTYTSDALIKWSIQTMTASYAEISDYSIVRQIAVYSEPQLAISASCGPESELVDLSDGDGVYSLPLYFNLTVTPATQTVITYYMEVIANSGYSLIDSTGDDISVAAGDRIFSKNYDVSTNPLAISLSAGDIIFENGVEYTFRFVASLNSGLTASNEMVLSTSFDPGAYNPLMYFGEISEDDYSIVLHPYCESVDMEYNDLEIYDRFYIYEDTSSDTVSYTLDDEAHGGTPDEDGNYNNCGIIFVGPSSHIDLHADISDIKTELFVNRERLIVSCPEIEEPSTFLRYEIRFFIADYGIVSLGGGPLCDGITIDYGDTLSKYANKDIEWIRIYIVNSDQENSYTFSFNFTFLDDGPDSVEAYSDDVTLSIYRREFDGTLTEIARNLDNTAATYFTDPHPALDYGRYRVVATETATGRITYNDIPPYEIGVKSIVINWNETWSSYDSYTTEAVSNVAEPLTVGSTLVLPYNIDVSENNTLDVSLVEYIGRKHPVSYYGTQVGQIASWSCEIPATDTETLYQLRRLSVWQGDVYVREPSGVGYWAQISVSMSQTHCELTIPVSIEITRVDGGM